MRGKVSFSKPLAHGQSGGRILRRPCYGAFKLVGGEGLGDNWRVAALRRYVSGGISSHEHYGDVSIAAGRGNRQTRRRTEVQVEKGQFGMAFAQEIVGACFSVSRTVDDPAQLLNSLT